MLLANCPVSVTLRTIGGKWKPLILRELKGGPVRFGVLQRRLPEASRKVLTQQLRELEASGVIRHMAETGRRPRSEYSFSAYGESLRPLLEEMARWGKRHRTTHSAAQTR